MKLTVLMPVHNAAGFLREAIASVLAQTHRDFSLLIIDDGSKDESLAVARAAIAGDSRAKVLTQSNSGIATTMNRGLEMAETDWVACMHGDDVMLPERLERQVAFIRANPDLAVASALVHLIDGKGRTIGAQRSPFTDRKTVADYLRRNQAVAFNHPSAILRRQAILDVGGYRQAFWPAEDMDLWNRLIEKGHGALVQDEYLLHYRIHGASASISRARLMMRKVEWIERCMIDRRAGRPEPTWDQFIYSRNHRPWPCRINAARKETARTLYQTSQHYLAAKKYRSLLPAMAGAALLEPSLVLGRILPRVARKLGMT
jgi:glycosyltransferase involved in cell wall biosynthesis